MLHFNPVGFGDWILSESPESTRTGKMIAHWNKDRTTKSATLVCTLSALGSFDFAQGEPEFLALPDHPMKSGRIPVLSGQ